MCQTVTVNLSEEFEDCLSHRGLVLVSVHSGLGLALCTTTLVCRPLFGLDIGFCITATVPIPHSDMHTFYKSFTSYLTCHLSAGLEESPVEHTWRVDMATEVSWIHYM